MNRLIFFVFVTLVIKAGLPPENHLDLIDFAAKKAGSSSVPANSSAAQLLLAHGTKAPAIPPRSDSIPRSLPVVTNTSLQEDKDFLPKSPPLTRLSPARKPLKMVTINVNVWHNDPCDEQLWKEILVEYFKLKNAPFNPPELFAGIIAFIKLTEEKKGKALWGGLSFTEVVDSQIVDQQKTNP